MTYPAYRGTAALPVCERCKGNGWLEPIGPCRDGSYITSRECPNCDGAGNDIRGLNHRSEEDGSMHGANFIGMYTQAQAERGHITSPTCWCNPAQDDREADVWIHNYQPAQHAARQGEDAAWALGRRFRLIYHRSPGTRHYDFEDGAVSNNASVALKLASVVIHGQHCVPTSAAGVDLQPTGNTVNFNRVHCDLLFREASTASAPLPRATAAR